MFDGGMRRAGFEPAFLSVRGTFLKIRSVIACSVHITLYIEIPWSVSPMNFAHRVGLETLLKKDVCVFFALQYLFVLIDPCPLSQKQDPIQSSPFQ